MHSGLVKSAEKNIKKKTISKFAEGFIGFFKGRDLNVGFDWKRRMGCKTSATGTGFFSFPPTHQHQIYSLQHRHGSFGNPYARYA